MKGRFINHGFFGTQKGYNIADNEIVKSWLFWDKVVYDFKLSTKYPLTFIHPDGTHYQPDKTFRTDQGSLPPFLQDKICAKDRFRGFYLHDSAYCHGGLWVSDGMGPYHFIELTRVQADDLLYEMMRADPYPANIYQLYAVFLGVRCGGAFTGYGKGDRRKTPKKPVNRIDPNGPPLAFA